MESSYYRSDNRHPSKDDPYSVDFSLTREGGDVCHFRARRELLEDLENTSFESPDQALAAFDKHGSEIRGAAILQFNPEGHVFVVIAGI